MGSDRGEFQGFVEYYRYLVVRYVTIPIYLIIKFNSEKHESHVELLVSVELLIESSFHYTPGNTYYIPHISIEGMLGSNPNCEYHPSQFSGMLRGPA